MKRFYIEVWEIKKLCSPNKQTAHTYVSKSSDLEIGFRKINMIMIHKCEIVSRIIGKKYDNFRYLLNDPSYCGF